MATGNGEGDAAISANESGVLPPTRPCHTICRGMGGGVDAYDKCDWLN